ncbi:hypothetical protein BOX15_Mlig030616g2 [Macrostomum lignano]|uniref:Amiloride-sensitive sodium channel n=1 Tax=Macrostomum lignano TaxID=282301 RepID=A0A267GU61_9PLAT|nr:hypothetical protein BOX15_Mlig030616g2 [Macrostomum lignano]
MSNVKAAATVLTEYGHRSTLHGLSHMFQSGDLWRKAFWLVLTFAASGACVYHIYATVSNYLESPITSIYRDEGPQALFPGVTICNLKPVSEALLHAEEEKAALFHHLDQVWNFFDNWLFGLRSRKHSETRVEYKERQRELLKTYTDIFWVSDDTREFGLSDRHTLLMCLYKNKHCNASNFKLVQHHRYWNCYTFQPLDGDRTIDNSDQDSGLRLILFTDSNFDSNRLDDSVNYLRSMTREDEITNPYSLRTYLGRGNRTLNQVLTGNKWEAEGLRIFIHNESQFPTTSDIAFDVSSGASTTIEVNTKQVNTLNRPPSHVCNAEEPETISYVRYFGPNVTGLRSYRLTQPEAVMEAQQKMIFDKCGCYTHLLPFKFNTSLLCLYADPQHRIHPSMEFMQRLACHTNSFKLAEQKTSELLQQKDEYKPCTSWKLQATKVQVPWPRSDELIDFVNYVFMPSYIAELQNEDQVMHLLKSRNSRAEAIIRHLFNPDCRKENGTDAPLVDSWCISRAKLKANVAQIWIKPASTHAGVYMEEYSYDWPEAQRGWRHLRPVDGNFAAQRHGVHRAAVHPDERLHQPRRGQKVFKRWQCSSLSKQDAARFRSHTKVPGESGGRRDEGAGASAAVPAATTSTAAAAATAATVELSQSGKGAIRQAWIAADTVESLNRLLR